MADVRDALEEFLTEERQPRTAGGDYEKVRCNLKVIQEYRAKRYSLAAIHSALLRGNILSCKFSTFKKYYYTIKADQSDQSVLPSASASSTPSSLPKSSAVENVGSVGHLPIGIKATELPLHDSWIGKGAEEVPEAESEHGEAVGNLDQPTESSGEVVQQAPSIISLTEEMKAQFDLAQKMFAARRNELRQNRGT